MHAGNFYSHAGYNKAMVLLHATKQQCGHNDYIVQTVMHGQASDVIIEYSNVKIRQHAVPVGISDGVLIFCDCMMLSFQIETARCK